LVISPLTKYLVEKYDEKYTGRQITMDWAYVNPFTGYIHFNGLKIYELKSDSIFFSAEGVNANFEMLKLFSKRYEISKLTLDHPKGIVILNKKDLNLDDLINKFSSNDTLKTKSEPVHFSILSIKINAGEFHYRDELIPVNYFIKEVSIESSGIRWNEDTIACEYSFLSGIGTGDMKGKFNINIKNLDYSFTALAHKFDLGVMQQYLKDLANYGNFSANFDTNVKAKGNFKDREDITASGTLAFNDFHFGKTKHEDYASFEKMSIDVIELSPKNFIYYIDSLQLHHPYIKYELYDHLDNIQAMFGKGGSNISEVNANPAKFNLVIEIAKYVRDLSENFLTSNYRINRLKISEGDVKYNDYSISEKFSVDADPLEVTADSIDKNHNRVEASFSCGIKPYGNAVVTLSINPKDKGDFDMHYHLRKLPAALFNPYTISYTSFPLDRGTIEIFGSWNVRNEIIKSDNHLVIIDPRVTKRIRNKDTKWIPMPLLLSFIRERGNVIDYEIPITGDLKNPKFHWKDVLLDLVENIFIKPVTTPYRIQVKNVEAEIERSLAVKWKMRSNVLQENQIRFIEKMAGFLLINPAARIVVVQEIYALKEKEYILFYEAKKKYFLSCNHKNADLFTEGDSLKVDKMSVKDSLFVHYLNNHINDVTLFTIQAKCEKLIGTEIVNAKFQQLNRERKEAFMFFFKKMNVERQVKISSTEHVIPYNGFSFYKINYKDQFPQGLIDAHHEMDELNEEVPRNKFYSERKNNSAL
jgi:hypothetical protein